MSDQPRATVGLPPKGGTPAMSGVDQGRIRLCGGLVVSVNRSWQVDTAPGQRPVAAFKAMAPLAFHASDRDRGGDHYLAAVAAHEAYWLGFEADDGCCFALTVDLNGVNLLSGQHGPSAVPRADPGNYLLVPDQPWLDTILGAEGRVAQLVPRTSSSTASQPGTVLELWGFAVDEADLAGSVDRQPEDPQPLYAQPQSSRASPNALPWRGRTIRDGSSPTQPCGQLTIHIVEPNTFGALTGTTLPAEMFQDGGDPPAPFDPFQ
jgi:hypothetical protein